MRNLLFSLLAVFALCLLPVAVSAQHVGIKSNMLYLATSTPNLGVEIRTADRFTLSLSGAYNPFNWGSYKTSQNNMSNSKLKHWSVMPEMKYWFCRAFERSYIGVHGIYGEYNLGGIRFIDFLKEYRYQGNAYGGGVSAGYQWAAGARWGVELSLGVGYLRMHYKKYDCGSCGSLSGEYKRNYIGPTKAAVSIIYYIR